MALHRISFLLLVALFQPLVAAAQVPVEGSLMGAGGRRMESAHVILRTSDLAGPSLVVPVDTDGRYRFEAEPGGYMLQAFGLRHKPLMAPLLLTDEPVQLDVQLGTYPLNPAADEIAVIGDFNEFDDDEGRVPMKLGGDGAYHASIPSSADSVAYQIIGAVDSPEPYLPAEHPWRIAGDGTDEHRFNRSGPWRRYQSNFVSIVPASGGTAEITFDPGAIPQSASTDPIIRSRPHTHAEIAALYGDTEARFAELSKALSAARASNSGESSSSPISAVTGRYIDPVVTRLQTEDDALVRQWLLLRYFAKFSQFQDDAASQMLPLALDQVEPVSPVWGVRAFFDFGVSNVIVRMAVAAGDDRDLLARVVSYVDAMLTSHPDGGVRAQALYIATSPMLRGEDEARLWKYYRMLVSEFPHSEYAEDLRRRYSPDRHIQTGEQIPGFEFVALGDSTRRYSDSGLQGSVYLMDFWGTWCGPCIQEMPFLHRAYERFAGDGFAILSVAFMDTHESIESFRAERYPMPWMHTLVTDEESESVREKFELTGFPRPVLVDEGGIIIATNEELRGEKLMETLDQIYHK